MRHQSSFDVCCLKLTFIVSILQHKYSGSRDQHYLRICKRRGSERVEDALEAEDAGEDGQEGGQGEDGQPQGVSQGHGGHGGHGGGGGPQQHYPAHRHLRSWTWTDAT